MNSILLDQCVYTEKVLEKLITFLGPAHKVQESPLPINAVDRIARVKRSYRMRTYVDNFPYRSLLGALLYVSMKTA